VLVEALALTGGSGLGVEKIFADVDADKDAIHPGPPESKNELRGPTAFLFELVNAGFVPSDYSNHDRRFRSGPNLLRT